MANNIFELKVDDKILDNLNDIDQKLISIEESASNVNKSFKDWSTTLNDIRNVFKGLGDDSLTNLGDSAEQTHSKIDELNKGIGDLGKTISMANALAMPDDSVTRITEKIKALRDIQATTSVDLTNPESVTNNQVLISTIDSLRDKLQELHRIASQAPITLVDAQSLPEDSITRITDKIKELKRIQKETTVDLADPKSVENNQRLLNQIDDLKRKLKELQTTKVTDTDALDFSKNAKSINERIEAIKRLNIARNQLSSGEVNYTQRVAALNAEIRRNTQLNNSLTDSTQRLHDKYSGLMNTSDQLMRKLALIFSVSQITNYMKKLANVTGEFELQNKALGAILQNKDEADKLFGQITELAVRSPFQIKELVTYTKQLAAYRVESNKLYDTTKMLADVSAGLGVDMNRLIIAYGQVKAANYLRGQELRQFSEAGINILGELSEYFTTLNGKMVTTADVFDMVSKRMVNFGDVEKIFQKLTTSGGIFYNMQEIQAETLKGKISNLTDSVDLMLNKIGTEQYGALSGAVGIVKLMADNYQVLQTILEGTVVAFGLYGLAAIRATASLGKFTTANIGATIAAKGFNGAVARVVMGIRTMNAAINANPFLLIASVIIAAGTALYRYNANIDENRKAYDALSNSTNNAIGKLQTYSKEIDKQNKAIKEVGSGTNKLKKGTKEYADAQEKGNKAIEEQQLLLNKLKTEFPEIYAGIVKQKDGTIDLNKALDDNIKKLQTIAIVNEMARQREAWNEDSVIKDAEQLSVALKENNKYAEEMKTSFGAIETRMSVLAKEGKITNDVYESFKKIAESEKDAAIKFSDFNKLILAQEGSMRISLVKLQSQFDSSYSSFNKNLGDYQDKVREFGDEIELVFQDILDSEGIYTKDAFNKSSDETKKRVTDMLTTILNSIPSLADKAMKDTVEKLVKTRINIPISLTVTPKSQIASWQEEFNKEVDKINNKGLLSIKITETVAIETDRETLRKKVNEAADEAQKALKDSEKNKLYLPLEIPKDATEEERQRLLAINEESRQKKQSLEEESAAWEKLREKVGAINKTTTDGESAAIKLMKEKVSLMEKLNSKYKDERKLSDKTASFESAKEAYAELIKELNAEPLIQKLTSFDDKSILAALNQLAPEAQKAGKDAVVALNSTLGKFGGTIDIEVRTEELNALEATLDKMFSDYTLSVEVEGLGLDSSTTSKLFDIDTTSLDEISEKLIALKDDYYALGTEGEKAYTAMEKKISNEQDKALKERLKKYSVYLKQSVSDRLQIELDTQRKIDEVMAMEEYSPVQKESIVQKIKVEAQKAMDKSQWEEFTQSDMYIRMFEDLENVSTRTLNLMRDKLIKLRGSFKELDASDLKEINDQIEKISEESTSRNPLRGLVSEFKNVIKFQKERKTLEDEYNRSQSSIENLKKQKDQQDKLLITTRQQYDSAVKKYGLTSKEANQLRIQLRIEEQQLNLVLRQLVAEGKISEEYAKRIRDGEQSEKSLGDKANEIGTYLVDGANAMGEVSGSMEQVFGTMDAATKDAVESAQEIIGGVGEAIQGFATGNYIQAAVGVAKAIAGVFAIGDKKKERQIQREAEKVKDLQKAYENLKSAIEKAYSIDTLSLSDKNAQKNLDAQISSYQKMIQLEEDKKKTDKAKIEEYKNAIEELKKEREDFNQSILEGLGGIGTGVKDAAQEFIDAWYEAFKETGDGLSGLEEKWDEYIDNVIKKQLMLRATSKYLEPLFNQIDAMFDDERAGGKNVTAEELAALSESAKDTFPQLNDFLTNLAESLGGVTGKGAGALSSLQKGIEGITETTAGIIESYLNSLRFEMFNQTTIFSDIRTALVGEMNITTPIVNELKAQTELIRSVNRLLDSVVFAGGNGYGIRTYLM